MTMGFGGAVASAGALPSVKTAFSKPVSSAPATSSQRRFFPRASSMNSAINPFPAPRTASLSATFPGHAMKPSSSRLPTAITFPAEFVAGQLSAEATRQSSMDK